MNREDVLSVGSSSVDEDVFSGNDWSALDASANRRDKQKTSPSEASDSFISSKQRPPSRSIPRTHSQLRTLVLKLFSPVLRSSTRKSTTSVSQSTTAPESHSKSAVRDTKQPSEIVSPRRDMKVSAKRRPAVVSAIKESSSRLLPLEKESKLSRRDLKVKQQTSSRRVASGNAPRSKETTERDMQTSPRRPRASTVELMKSDRPRPSMSTEASTKRLSKESVSVTTKANERAAPNKQTQLPNQPSRRAMNGSTAAATTSILRSPSPTKLQRSERRLTFAKTPSRRTLKEEDLEEDSLTLARRRLVQTSDARSERNLTRISPSPVSKESTFQTDAANSRSTPRGLDQRTSIASKSRRELIQMASQRRFSSSGGGDELPRGPSRRNLTKSPIAKDRSSRITAQPGMQKQPEIEWKPELTAGSLQVRHPLHLKDSVKTNDAVSRTSGKTSRNTETSLSSAGRAKSKKEHSRRALLSSTGKSVASLKSQRSVAKEETAGRRKVVQQPHGTSKRTDNVKKESTRKLVNSGEKSMPRSSSKKNVTSRSPRRRSMDKRPKTFRARSVSPTEPTETSDHDFSQTSTSIPLFRLTYKNNGFRSERALEKDFELDPILNKVN